MIEFLTDLPENVLGVSGVGTVTDADYREKLIPFAEAKLKAHGRLRLLYHLGPKFEHFEARAMFDDAAFGLRHLREFERIGVVTDVPWCRSAVRMMSFLIPCPVRLFDHQALDEARAWIKEPSAPSGA